MVCTESWLHGAMEEIDSEEEAHQDAGGTPGDG
jgi:hypothetical protein